MYESVSKKASSSGSYSEWGQFLQSICKKLTLVFLEAIFGGRVERVCS